MVFYGFLEDLILIIFIYPGGCSLPLKPDLTQLSSAAFPTLLPGDKKYEKSMEEVIPFGSLGYLLTWEFTLLDDFTILLGFPSNNSSVSGDNALDYSHYSAFL